MTDILTIRGFKFAAATAGVKSPAVQRLDVGLIAAQSPASAACVTTTNLVVAAPVAITRERLAAGRCQAVLANSGNANAFTGAQGERDARDLTAAAAAALGIDPALVVPMSTGVIGQPMPVERIRPHVAELVDRLDERSLEDFAAAIMTTDTRPKTACVDGELSTGPIRMLGVAKGSGMIAPNMATMLAVVLADYEAEPEFLREALRAASDSSFNCISVDGDMSTNDTLMVMAGGRADAPRVRGSADHNEFARLLTEACRDLARQMVFDGEGATKLVEVRVTGGPDHAAARLVARTVAESLLVKTAFRGEDPNWGRIICAAGRSGVKFDPGGVDLFIGDVSVVRDGLLAQDDWERRAAQVMKRREFSIMLDLKAGPG
ncbi:MAG: bifunctional glutamate N-acetyltransferase/amino-acid acetyltransferase ArgJ, partial [Desulfomonile sp.]|nr:bifunctional glutamate N-acetyltransferase/amino-acid acetyltransferase ArgJ [Desulfomonile sp.]